VIGAGGYYNAELVKGACTHLLASYLYGAKCK